MPSTKTARKATAATRANATIRALKPSGRYLFVVVVVSSTAEQTDAQSSRVSLGVCSVGRCGRPSPCARRGRRGSAGPDLRAATVSTAPGGVVPASAWHAASRATDGVRGAGLKKSAEAGWAVGTGRTGVPASSSSRARSSCVEGPAIGVEGGDSIRCGKACCSRAVCSPRRRDRQTDRQTEKRTA